MKTKQEVECMKQELSRKIETLGEKARNTPYGSVEWLMYDREYAKCVAQYNILLDVLN